MNNLLLSKWDVMKKLSIPKSSFDLSLSLFCVKHFNNDITKTYYYDIENIEFHLIDNVIGYTLSKDNQLYYMHINKKHRKKGYGKYLLELFEKVIFSEYNKVSIRYPISPSFFLKLGYKKDDKSGEWNFMTKEI